MKKKKAENLMAKYLLVAGCQRSGTTILTACLGRHPKINMLNKATQFDVLKGIGKEYNGNKLCLYGQIRKKQKATRFGYLINRIVNLGKDFNNRKPFPISRMSIEDYKKHGAKIIYIVRDKEYNINSMMRRAGYSRRLAEKTLLQSIK